MISAANSLSYSKLETFLHSTDTSEGSNSEAKPCSKLPLMLPELTGVMLSSTGLQDAVLT